MKEVILVAISMFGFDYTNTQSQKIEASKKNIEYKNYTFPIKKSEEKSTSKNRSFITAPTNWIKSG